MAGDAARTQEDSSTTSSTSLQVLSCARSVMDTPQPPTPNRARAIALCTHSRPRSRPLCTHSSPARRRRRRRRAARAFASSSEMHALYMHAFAAHRAELSTSPRLASRSYQLVIPIPIGVPQGRCMHSTYKCMHSTCMHSACMHSTCKCMHSTCIRVRSTSVLVEPHEMPLK